MNIITDQTEDVLIIPEIKSSLRYLQETLVNVQLLMHPSFVSTIPPRTGMGRDSDFHFSEPWYNPTLWGKYHGNNPTLSPAQHYSKSHLGKCPNAITPALTWDNQKLLALHHSSAIPPLCPLVGGGGGGGAWIQMTGVLQQS